MPALKSRLKTVQHSYLQAIEDRIKRIRERPEVWELFGVLLLTDDHTLSRTFRWAKIGPGYCNDPRVKWDFVTSGMVSEGLAVSWDIQMLEIITLVCWDFAIYRTEVGGLVWLRYDDYTFHPQEIPEDYGWWVYAPRAESAGVKSTFETDLLKHFRSLPKKARLQSKPIPLLRSIHKELFR